MEEHLLQDQFSLVAVHIVYQGEKPAASVMQSAVWTRWGLGRAWMVFGSSGQRQAVLEPQTCIASSIRMDGSRHVCRASTHVSRWDTENALSVRERGCVCRRGKHAHTREREERKETERNKAEKGRKKERKADRKRERERERKREREGGRGGAQCRRTEGCYWKRRRAHSSELDVSSRMITLGSVSVRGSCDGLQSTGAPPCWPAAGCCRLNEGDASFLFQKIKQYF